MVYRIEKGGNYGWSVTEGDAPVPARAQARARRRSCQPVVEHHHTEFRSITGGYVYHGKRLPELTGRVHLRRLRHRPDLGAALRRQGKVDRASASWPTRTLRIVAFGEDAAGEVYLRRLHRRQHPRLVAAPPPAERRADVPAQAERDRPVRLDQGPHAGAGADSLLGQRRSCGPTARQGALPRHPGRRARSSSTTVTYPQPAPGRAARLAVPRRHGAGEDVLPGDGAGQPDEPRRLETRLLHFEQLAGTEEVGDQVLARLHLRLERRADRRRAARRRAGSTATYTIDDADGPGGKREQTWHFPSRAECTLCHTMAAKYVAGRQHAADEPRPRLRRRASPTSSPRSSTSACSPSRCRSRRTKLPQLADYHDANADLDARARSYLHANCSHCHRKWGGGNAEFQLLHTLPLAETGALDTRPGQGTFDLNDPRILVPGDPERSLILHRMEILGLGRMPHIASNVVDREGVELINDWIEQMPK